MNWIVSSTFMVLGSVLLYLTVRKSSILRFPTAINNLSMFFVPLAIFAIMGIVSGANYSISISNLGLIALSAIFFNYLGSVTSLKSIELAPNPGYSLVISKSYVVFTTIISFLFLNGEITARKALAIVLIVIFSAVIGIDPKKTNQNGSKLWLAYTMYSFFAWGLLSLTIKYLTLQGLSTLTVVTYMYVFVSIIIILEIFLRKIRFALNKVNISYFLAIGAFSALFNYFNFYSVSIAPNVGYVNAINASSISIVTIFSIILFGDEYSPKKMVGVFGVTLGLFMLIL